MKNELGKEFQLYAMKEHGISSLAMHNFSASITPYILEERQMNVAQLDVFSRLMLDRVIFLGTEINDYVSNVITAQLLFLESTDAKKDIQIYLNSPGGSVMSGNSIVDTIQYIKPDVSITVTGIAASMAAIILSVGTKGKRYSLKHSRIMIHQPLGGISGQCSDIEITSREIQKHKKELYDILSENTGQTYKKIEKDADRDFWMTSEEAKKYGIIDNIIIKRN